jgi:hypothetical protein
MNGTLDTGLQDSLTNGIKVFILLTITCEKIMVGYFNKVSFSLRKTFLIGDCFATIHLISYRWITGSPKPVINMETGYLDKYPVSSLIGWRSKKYPV